MGKNELDLVRDYKVDEIRAAYALNYCTVSVSQIIDYKDVNVLEQEYEAILNNLNLEVIPKDEALLNILKQLLDTITFFRISEGDKKFIDKEYQLQVKNAIWASAPQFGMCIATGNPFAIAFSFLSQVGIGYMNYRNNKDVYILERDKKLWQLQKTAIEQFNGLRRELFDTAWRMTANHSISDKLRLTENQINQFNAILSDSDIQRRYERLDTVKEFFIAYPPFWYYLGNAAYYLYANESAGYYDEGMEQEDRDEYRIRAKECYEMYRVLMEGRSILREDPISATCFLEYADLLIHEDSKKYKTEIVGLVKSAETKSGYAFDVMELCAIEYLKINDVENAARLLKRLVNEDYNTIINAQLLSSIYVRTKNTHDYRMLKRRVPVEFLYEMPNTENYSSKMIEDSAKSFAERQREIVKFRYKEAINLLIEKHVIEWNKVTSTFDMEEEYPEDYFSSNPTAFTKRIQEARRILNDAYKKEVYLERLNGSGLELSLVDSLNSFTSELFMLPVLSDTNIQQEFIDSVGKKKNALNSKLEVFSNAIELKDKFNADMYISMQKQINFAELIRDAISGIVMKQIEIDIANVTMEEISTKEENLRSFCKNTGIEEPQVAINEKDEEKDIIFESGEKYFEVGNKQKRAVKNRHFIDELEAAAKESIKKNSFIIDSNMADILYRTDKAFESYFAQLKFEKYPQLRSHTFMVLRDQHKPLTEFAFTTEGIVPILFGRPQQKCEYKNVFYNMTTKGLHFEGLLRYYSKNVNTEIMYKFIKSLDKTFINDLDARTLIFTEDVIVSFRDIMDKLEESGIKLENYKKLVLMTPETETMYHLGYKLSRVLPKESNLVVFTVDEEKNTYDNLRIISFVNILTDLQQSIEEHNGFMVVEL